MAFCSTNFKPYTYGLELRATDLEKQRNWIRAPPVPSNPKGARSLSAITNHLFVCACPENCPVRRRASWEVVDRLDTEFSIEGKGLKIFEFLTNRSGLDDKLDTHQYFKECYALMTFNQKHCQARKSANGHRGQRYWEMPGKGTQNRKIFDKCCYYGPSNGAVTVRFVRGPVSILVIAYLEDKAIQQDGSTADESYQNVEERLELEGDLDFDVMSFCTPSLESSVETDQSNPSSPTGLEGIFDATDSVLLDENDFMSQIFNFNLFATVDSPLDVNLSGV